MKVTRKLALGEMVGFLILFTVSCASRPVISTPCYPPFVYLQTVPEPQLTGRTNADLAIYTVELLAALRLANSDKVALKAWADSQY
jgi:hypothetical protein